MTEDQFLKKFNKFINAKHGGRFNASVAWGCSPAMVTMVADGNRVPMDIMLEDIGIERKTNLKVWYEVKNGQI